MNDRNEKIAFGLWALFIIIMAVIFALLIEDALAQEPLRPSGRIAPGPDSTPTPTPTPGPPPPCKWIQTPWGGSRCDVREVCVLNLMPMHIGTPQTTYVRINTPATKAFAEELVPFQDGPLEMKTDWPNELKFIEWYARGSSDEYGEKPMLGCYCDEKRGKIVICLLGEFDSEVDQ